MKATFKNLEGRLQTANGILERPYTRVLNGVLQIGHLYIEDVTPAPVPGMAPKSYKLYSVSEILQEDGHSRVWAQAKTASEIDMWLDGLISGLAVSNTKLGMMLIRERLRANGHPLSDNMYDNKNIETYRAAGLPQ